MPDKNFTEENCPCGKGKKRIYKDGHTEITCSRCIGEYLMNEIYFPEDKLRDLNISRDASYMIPVSDQNAFYTWFGEIGSVVAECSDATRKYPKYRITPETYYELKKMQEAIDEMTAERDWRKVNWATGYRETLFNRIAKDAPFPFYDEYAPAIIDLVTYYDREQIEAAIKDLAEETKGDLNTTPLLLKVRNTVSNPRYTEDKLSANDNAVQRCLSFALEHHDAYDDICRKALAEYKTKIISLQKEIESLSQREAELVIEVDHRRRQRSIDYYDYLFNEIWSAYLQYDAEQLYSSGEGIIPDDDTGTYTLIIDE